MHVAFTEREMDAMGVLWQSERGSTVSELREGLTDDLAYTTVLTVLRRLEEKGSVEHAKNGKAYRYSPLVDRQTAGSFALRRLVRKVFRGSAELLFGQVIADGCLTRDQMLNVRNMLDERLGGDICHVGLSQPASRL